MNIFNGMLVNRKTHGRVLKKSGAKLALFFDICKKKCKQPRFFVF